MSEVGDTTEYYYNPMRPGSPDQYSFTPEKGESYLLRVELHLQGETTTTNDFFDVVLRSGGFK